MIVGLTNLSIYKKLGYFCPFNMSIKCSDGQHISDNKIFWLTIFFTVCYLSFGIVTRLIIGISAIAEGRDRRHGILYFPLRQEHGGTYVKEMRLCSSSNNNNKPVNLSVLKNQVLLTSYHMSAEGQVGRLGCRSSCSDTWANKGFKHHQTL